MMTIRWHLFLIALLLGAMHTVAPCWAADPSLHFDVTFDQGYAIGDRFDATSDPPVNQLQAKAEGDRPYRKFTDIRSKLGKDEGRWTAAVRAAAGPFDSAYLHVEVPAGETLAGRFELYHPPAGQKRNHDIWFIEFDYARLTSGKGGNELLVLEMKNRWGEIIGRSAMWYHAWLGDWKNAKSNRNFESGKRHRVRYEVDFVTDQYVITFDGEKIEEGKVERASEFGGISFVFAGRKSDEARVFGLDNIRIGSIVSPHAEAAAAQPKVSTAPAQPDAGAQPKVSTVAAQQPAAVAPKISPIPAQQATGAQPGANIITAHRAADFLDSMGINVVIFDDERHTKINIPRLDELGIKHIRVGLRKAELKDYRGDGAILLSNIKALGQRGYKITGIWNCWHTMAEFVTICEFLLPDALHQVEGPNEPWHKQENFKWKGEGWPLGPKAFMEDMHATVRGNENMKHLPIVSFSGTTSGYGSIENLIDYGNEHIYPEAGKAFTSGDELAKKIERCRTTNYPTLPLQFTETGYNSGEGEKAGYQAASQSMQTRGVPRLFLEAYRHGLKRTFLYALYARDDQGFSLLERDGSPKPAFRAVAAIVKLLTDAGEDATTFTPTPLDIAVDTDVATVHHLLLQKSDGRYYLCLWNDVDGWDSTTKQDLVNQDVAVRLTFGRSPTEVKAYRPTTNALMPVKTAPAEGATLNVMTPDHPLIFELRFE